MIKTEYVQAQLFPDWMTTADSDISNFQDRVAVSSEHFEKVIAERGEGLIWASETKRDGPSTRGPSPQSCVVTATVLVVWSESLVAVQKIAMTGWWPVEFGAFAIEPLFKNIPIGCNAQILLDTEDLRESLKEWSWLLEHPYTYAGGWECSQSSKEERFQERSGSSVKRWTESSFS
jgi:hypothetical protein